MGGAWAYEALSFGGFWAWDPVENSSLVPWLVLVAGAHLLLINKAKPGTAVTATYLMIALGFLLVVYSTFLTKSGILGDTSVHSFVDSGILPQLLGFLLACCALLCTLILPPGRDRVVFGALQAALAVGIAVANPALCTLGSAVGHGLGSFEGTPQKPSPYRHRKPHLDQRILDVCGRHAHVRFCRSHQLSNQLACI